MAPRFWYTKIVFLGPWRLGIAERRGQMLQMFVFGFGVVDFINRGCRKAHLWGPRYSDLPNRCYSKATEEKEEMQGPHAEPAMHSCCLPLYSLFLSLPPSHPSLFLSLSFPPLLSVSLYMYIYIYLYLSFLASTESNVFQKPSTCFWLQLPS